MSLASSSSSLWFRFRFVALARVVPPRPLGLPPRLPLVPPRPRPVPLPLVEVGVAGGTVSTTPAGFSTGSAFTLAVLPPPPLPLLPPVLGLGFAFTFGTVAGISRSSDVTIWLSTDSLAACHAGVFGAELAFPVLATRVSSELVGGEKEGTAKVGVILCWGEIRGRGVELKKPRRGGEPLLGVEVWADWV